MIALLATVFVTSLLGSLHCAGMCGPFVVFAVSNHSGLSPRFSAQLATNAAYHAGRFCIYVALGALFGALGGALTLSAGFAGIQHAATWIAGATLIVLGVLTCIRHFSATGTQFAAPHWLTRIVRAGHRVAAEMRPLPRAGVIGLLTALVPCGWLYGFVIAAAGTQSAATGALLMTAFWLGTLPVLAAAGFAAQRLIPLLGRRLQLATAFALVAIGVLIVSNRVNALEPIRRECALQANRASSVAARVSHLESTKPACCRSGS